METFKVSPSNLASMASPYFCEKCFWRILHLRFKKPFVIPMPGIMHYLDAHQKQLARAYLKENNKLPSFFGKFTNAAKILDIEWVECLDDETGILVRGKPDLVIEMKNGNIIIVDNKTAIYHGEDDVMFPRYECQTNCYGHCLLSEDPPRLVTALALLHYEFDKLPDDELLEVVGDEEVWARFRPRLVEVELAPDKHVRPRLQELRNFVEMENVPEGREGCKDCALLDTIIGMTAEDRVTDEVLQELRPQEHARRLATLRYRRVLGADSFLAQHPTKSVPVVAVEPQGVFALWDFTDEK